MEAYTLRTFTDEVADYLRTGHHLHGVTQPDIFFEERSNGLNVPTYEMFLKATGGYIVYNEAARQVFPALSAPDEPIDISDAACIRPIFAVVEEVSHILFAAYAKKHNLSYYSLPTYIEISAEGNAALDRILVFEHLVDRGILSEELRGIIISEAFKALENQFDDRYPDNPIYKRAHEHYFGHLEASVIYRKYMELKSSGKIDEAYKLIQIYYFAIHPREKGEIIFELFTEEELNWHNGVIRKRYEPSDR